MKADASDVGVTLTLSVDEAKRLAVLLYEVTCLGSRAEFWIRTGCSTPNVRAIRDDLWALASGESQGFEVALVAGEEGVENPWRPRPGRESPRDSA